MSKVGIQIGLGPSSIDIAAGLIHDQVDYAVESKTKPALLSTYVDSYFGVTVRRITAGTGGGIKPVYSTIPIWNYDETYMLMYNIATGAYRLHNGTTYAFIRNISISPYDIEQAYWSPVDPDDLFWADANILKCYHPSSDTSSTVRTFSGITDLTSGGDPMYLLSWDGDRVCIGAFPETTKYLYKISTDEILSQISASGYPPQIAPSGDLVYLGTGSSGTVRNATAIGTVVRSLDLLSGQDHASLGRLTDGTDTLFICAYDPPAGKTAIDYTGALIAHDLTDASFRVIVGQKTGWKYPSPVHISAIGYKVPGWVVISTYNHTGIGGSELGEQEVQLVKCDMGQETVYRVCHHRSIRGADYFSEPHASASPSGTRIVFGSNWGGSTVDTYVAELPSYG